MFIACTAKFWQYNKANFTQISYLCIHIHMCLEYVCILEYSLFNTLLIIFYYFYYPRRLGMIVRAGVRDN